MPDNDDLIINSQHQSISVTLISGDITATCSASSWLAPDGLWCVDRALVRRPQHRRQGIGSRLLRVLQETAVKRKDFGYLVVSPGGYNMKHEDQVRFYEKNGFVRSTTESDTLIWRP
jgi:GNAT superfamily N-acetyltransferase